MGKYQAYPEYEDTKVQWLPDLPQHWGIERIKRMLRLKRTLVGKKSSEYQLLSLTLKGIITRDISTGEGKIPESFDTYQEVEKNDLVFCLFDMDETPRTVGLSALDGMITGAYNVYGCLDKCYPAYASYYFLHIDKFKGLRPFYTGLRKVVRSETFDNIEIPCPPYEEQTQIANFLDHETAKIDTLIEKQQQLIKLLKEKRQAVISHAVTKGLNPQAPMKDSGVEWLGEVPEHWAVMKFNHCAQIRNGLVDPKGTKYRDMVLYAPNHIEKATGKVLYRETASEQGADSNKYLCYQGEVIYSKIRPALAKVAICTEELALCSADMYPISCINGLTNEWLYWFMLSDSFTKAVVLDSDRVAMPKVNRESLGDYKIPFPTESEQSDISSHIKAQTQKLDVLEAKANNAIKLMQERRTALISAAVTGKIDVRNWQAPISQEQALEQTA
ncbi:restriction endonuclease subunit S [Vibrio parahaemolyticus]|nr:restriction endonuclease subunit S [Vibrio parahaemolyticus]MBE3701930.1 restriction endonuclease subunit S [Vibrio parahaemolyticus]MBE3766959.1 restriction endonuclease subunit S [Vibrio parahaemolyticus]